MEEKDALNQNDSGSEDNKWTDHSADETHKKAETYRFGKHPSGGSRKLLRSGNGLGKRSPTPLKIRTERAKSPKYPSKPGR